MQVMPARNKIINTFLALAFFVLILPSLTHAAKPDYIRLFYYQGGANARQSFYTNVNSIDVLAPQVYKFGNDGKLIGKLDAEILKFAKDRNVKVMPLVTNDAFTQKSYKTILDDQSKQADAIKSLIDEAIRNEYWGWQIDFEQMDISYKDKFSKFVERAYGEMQKNDLVFSVAVIAKISDKPSDYPKNLWQKLIGAYDYAAIASSTDFVSLMSYDDPYSKGPVAQYSWLEKVLDYSLDRIPNEKLSLGIPFYYWLWDDARGKRIEIGGNKGIQDAFSKHYITTRYSTKHQAPYLTWWSYSKSYTLWYENARSVAKKIELVKKNDLHGFSAWALGLELASVYSVMK
jgi:spore germination protein YaaH